MPFRPVRLRKQIVHEIDAAGREQSQRIVEVRELAWQRVRVDQVEAVRALLEERPAVGQDNVNRGSAPSSSRAID